MLSVSLDGLSPILEVTLGDQYCCKCLHKYSAVHKQIMVMRVSCY